MRTPLAIGAALVLGAFQPARAAESDAPPISFARDIRPILSNKCFLCHGPDEGARKAGLRLDSLEDATKETKSGARAIVPGDLDASELVARIRSDDPTQAMPPPDSGKALSDAERDLLARWVAEGAAYARHWAFAPPEKPEPPEAADPAWRDSAVDRFVLDRLAKAGLSPNAEADRVTLIRRLSLDLTGLPPTPEEVDAFLADSSVNAYGTVVERLLASPHHGERWGRLWLDAARYADSDGFEKDKTRQVHFYRDWVVKSINDDLPYDQFVIRQVAGDLLPDADQDATVATGFLRNSMINEEGGVDPEQFRMEAMFDRMDALGKGVLGLTIQCAQCHTHKFDPITHEEYYRMFAFLNDCDEANVAVYTPEEQARRASVFGRIREVEEGLRHTTPDWDARMAAWEDALPAQPEWVVLRPEQDASGDQKHYVQADGSILCAGYAPTKFTTEFSDTVDMKTIRAARLELLNDANLPFGGPGRSPVGTFGLTEFIVEVAPADEPDQTRPVKIARAFADVNPPETPLAPMFDDKSGKVRVTGPIGLAIDGKDETAWGVDVGPGRSNVPRVAVFEFEKPVEFPSVATVTIKLKQNHGGWNSDDNQNNNLGRFRLSVTAGAPPAADPLPPRVSEALAVPRADRTEARTNRIFSHWRTTVAEWSEWNGRIEAIWAEHPAGAGQLVLGERADPRMTSILDRGDFLKPKQAVEPGVPAFLNPLKVEGAGPPDRLDFARWLASRESPTTARSVVNRVWQAYFGTGIVSTSEDLGSQSDAPSHPELLDWLAVDFMENGWSLKRLHRTIAQSSAYRQSSVVTPEKLAADPYNRLISRGARYRVDAEVVRDLALAASGLLNSAVGGPSVFPPAPAFLFEPPTSYGPKTWPESKGADRYRRALYTFRYRSVPYPMLQAFDAPNGDASCVRRSRSNTPLQALTTMNEPMFLECARGLARLAAERPAASDDERIEYAFRRCLARRPSETERAVLRELLDEQTTRFASEGVDPWSLAAADPSHPPSLPEGITPARLAAWTAVARVLLNLDETITRE